MHVNAEEARPSRELGAADGSDECAGLALDVVDESTKAYVFHKAEAEREQHAANQAAGDLNQASQNPRNNHWHGLSPLFAAQNPHTAAEQGDAYPGQGQDAQRPANAAEWDGEFRIAATKAERYARISWA